MDSTKANWQSSTAVLYLLCCWISIVLVLGGVIKLFIISIWFIALYLANFRVLSSSYYITKWDFVELVVIMNMCIASEGGREEREREREREKERKRERKRERE